MKKNTPGITRELVTMATQSVPSGSGEQDDDGDGNQQVTEQNISTSYQSSASPESVLNQKQLKTQQYPSKDVLPQKVY